MTFGEVLTELRRRRCLSQEELAEATGVSVRTISNLERGTTRPQRATLRALTEGLALTVDEVEVFELALRQPGLAAAPEAAVMLPAPVTPIIGRDAELATLVRLLGRPGERVVTVTGPGGVGKSRLALEVAWRVADRYDRVDAVDLSTLRDRDEVLAALGTAVGLRAAVTPAAIAARIGDAAWLLLLDSAEHVPGAAPDLADLVDLCGGLRLLSTTREPWERPPGRVWPLAPLSVPDRRVPTAGLAAYPAVALLLDRVRAVRPDFGLTDANAGAVVALCRRLDGLPLAIELAAGHLRDRDVAEVEAELAARSMTLRADVVDLPGRHRTLRATVEWSTHRLSDVDRERLAGLGAFRGTVARAALTAVLERAGRGTTDLDRSLERLAATSLVSLDPETGAVDLLDTIRETAADLLRDSPDGDRYRDAHVRYMVDLVRAGEYAAIDAQVDDVRAALGHAIAGPAAGLLDLDVVRNLAGYLSERGRYAEAHRFLAAIADVTGDPDVRSIATLRAGVAANQHGDYAEALRLGERLLATDADPDRRVAGLNLLGAAQKCLGDPDRAIEYYLECLAGAEALENDRYVTVALNNLGTVAHDRGDYDEAERRYRRSLEIKRSVGDGAGIAVALINLSSLAKDQARPEEAVDLLTEAVTGLREQTHPYPLAFALAVLAEVRLALGDATGATDAARESAAIGEEIEQPAVLAMAGQAFGDIARHAGDLARAEAHYLDALALRPEPAERMRMLDRLAATVLPRDRAAAARWSAEAETIRNTMRYPVPPADRPMVEATRAALDT